MAFERAEVSEVEDWFDCSIVYEDQKEGIVLINVGM